MQIQSEPVETRTWKTRRKGGVSIFDPGIIRRAIPASLRKLDPRWQIRNPVMFVVEIGSMVATIEFVRLLFAQPASGLTRSQLTFETIFVLAVSIWLWFTVIFANFAEAMAEGRGKAQADALRKARTTTMARRLPGHDRSGVVQEVAAPQLRKGDLVLVEAGQIIPGDGDVVEGVASVDESAITGESAPVIRESGGDRSAVTGGTRVLSDWIVVQICANPGETFLDCMIALVEGARRQKTPNEIALNILITSLTIIFVLVVLSLEPFAIYAGGPVSVTTLIALLVCLIPTTIGGLLSAIGIAGMDRMVQRNVLAMSGRAVEAAGDVDVLLLDKTGTVTLGNRMATRFVPLSGIGEHEVARATMLASISDETPEGRSVVTLACERYGLSGEAEAAATFVPFSALTRMSGVDLPATRQTIRKGAADSVAAYVAGHGGEVAHTDELQQIVDGMARAGSTPLVVAQATAGTPAEQACVLGVIELKDIVKGGMRERFEELRRMGIRTVMITGDNPLTAAAIAREAGVDDFLAQATPETRMQLIREHQQGGRMVAMTGDGTNDAPALAQADVGVAMNTGTQAAKEAANMVDLDSNPTRLIEVVAVGKQLLITRGALTTFSIANDVARYFAIIPAAFAVTYPQLNALNIMGLAIPHSAVLSAVIFNALIIIALIPLALRGIRYRPIGAGALLRRNLLLYGLGGILVPFLGIKLIDLVLVALHLAL
jgi:K+-transporting ATPase ATPase B chain